MNGRVLICGTFRNTRRCSVPNRGKAFVPYEVDLDKLLDIALLLGINAPEKDRAREFPVQHREVLP